MRDFYFSVCRLASQRGRRDLRQKLELERKDIFIK